MSGETQRKRPQAVTKRSVSLRPDQHEWLVEESWRRRTTVSGLLQDLIDSYQGQRPADESRDQVNAR